MTLVKIVKGTVVLSAVGFIILAGMYPGSTKVHADASDDDAYLAAIGMSIAPSFINIAGKDPTLVGLGSFIVHAQADCNGCHGSDPANEYLPTNNPYFLAPNNYPKYNQATYMNGGQNFGPAGPGLVKNPASPLFYAPGLGPNIITRNLTPDYTGNPEGGHDLATFMAIMRTGHDYDQLHLNCSATVTDNCYYAPVNGAVLQVMPWPKFGNMTDYQLTAIWTYLSTVPCNAHNDPLGTTFPWLQNTCTLGTTPNPTASTFLSASCGPTSLPYGGNYYCNVNVGSNAGKVLGSITYTLDTNPPVNVPLSGDLAEFSLITPSAGPHTVVIAYPQQGNFKASGPATEKFTVTP